MIMDPGINGRETLEKILENHPDQKSIIVSGYAETEDVKMALKMGSGQYVKKPYNIHSIGNAVMSELNKGNK
jgi:YesN/AraC family two-component response regulator